MKEPLTRVIFRKWPKKEGGPVIALFPSIAGDSDPSNCSSYESIGQHGAAMTSIAGWTEPAKPSEYRDLARELRGLGYRLKIVKRFTRKDYEERVRQLKV